MRRRERCSRKRRGRRSSCAAAHPASTPHCPIWGRRNRRLVGWGCSVTPVVRRLCARHGPAPPQVCRGCYGRPVTGQCWRAGRPSQTRERRTPTPSKLLRSVGKIQYNINYIIKRRITTLIVKWNDLAFIANGIAFNSTDFVLH